MIAWRIMLMTLLGCQVPDCEPHLMYADHELDFLHTYARKHDLVPPLTLGDAVCLVAHLGGYRDHKHDPDTDNQIMWHAQTRLTSYSLGHEMGCEEGYEVGFEAGKQHVLRDPDNTLQGKHVATR